MLGASNGKLLCDITPPKRDGLIKLSSDKYSCAFNDPESLHSTWIMNINEQEEKGGGREGALCIRWGIKGRSASKEVVPSCHSVIWLCRQTLQARGHNWKRVGTVCLWPCVAKWPHDFTRIWPDRGWLVVAYFWCPALSLLPSANSHWIPSCPWALLPFWRVVFLPLLIKTMSHIQASKNPVLYAEDTALMVMVMMWAKSNGFTLTCNQKNCCKFAQWALSWSPFVFRQIKIHSTVLYFSDRNDRVRQFSELLQYVKLEQTNAQN